MKKFLLAAAVLVLAGCAAPTTPLTPAPVVDQGVIVVGTLAPMGSLEWQVAPDYTRLATVRRLAARHLNNGAITVDAARQVQTEADAARKNLDEAIDPKNKGISASLIAKARDQIARAYSILEGVK